jgi:hypothetical protein
MSINFLTKKTGGQLKKNREKVLKKEKITL